MKLVHSNYIGNFNIQNCLPNPNGLTNVTEILNYIFGVVILQMKYKTKFWKIGFAPLRFPKLWSCELKISKFGGLRAKIVVKIRVVEAKMSIFSQKGPGVLWSDYCLKWDPCELRVDPIIDPIVILLSLFPFLLLFSFLFDFFFSIFFLFFLFALKILGPHGSQALGPGPTGPVVNPALEKSRVVNFWELLGVRNQNISICSSLYIRLHPSNCVSVLTLWKSDKPKKKKLC